MSIEMEVISPIIVLTLMKLLEHGYCIYHDEVVTDSLCRYKEERCLSCSYLMSKEAYITVEEAAELLGKSQPTIRAWIRKGKLKAKMVEFSRKYGRRYYRYRTWFILRNSLPTTI